MNPIKVSVVMAVYNAMPYLRQALDTVCNQMLREIEIICVDDGSTDDSYQTLQEYAAKDARITVLQHLEKTDGAAAARNMGMEHAQGEYLSFLDADDFFEPDMLEKAYEKAKEADADVVIFDGYVFHNQSGSDQAVDWILESSFLPSEDVFQPHENADGLFLMTMGAAWSALFRRKLVIDNGIRFESIYHTDDQNFTYLAYACANRIAVIRERFIHYRKFHGTGQSAKVGKHPESGYMAPYLLKQALEKRDIYGRFKVSLALRLLKTAQWHLTQMADKEHFETLYYALKNQYLAELGVYDLTEEQIYPKEGYRWKERIRRCDAMEFLFEQIKGEPDKIVTDILTKTPIRMGDNIVLYGAGQRGINVFNDIFRNRAFRIAAWLDKQGETIGFPVSAPDGVETLAFDYILVTIESENTYHVVKRYLLSKGIDEEKICWIG